jgi:23S rRNA pseudouridine1911/1915/1917 synthase
MEKSSHLEILVPEDYHLERIDRFLSSSLELDLSRSFIQRLIKNGNILVNGKAIKANYKAKTDDAIVIDIPEPEELELEPENIPLDIVYEDSSIIVINKQPGLVVHPGPGNWKSALVIALLNWVSHGKAVKRKSFDCESCPSHAACAGKGECVR